MFYTFILNNYKKILTLFIFVVFYSYYWIINTNILTYGGKWVLGIILTIITSFFGITLLLLTSNWFFKYDMQLNKIYISTYNNKNFLPLEIVFKKNISFDTKYRIAAKLKTDNKYHTIYFVKSSIPSLLRMRNIRYRFSLSSKQIDPDIIDTINIFTLSS